MRIPASSGNIPPHRSITKILGALAWRANVLLPMICLGIFAAFAIAINHQTQLVICGLAGTELENMSAPIAREIALGEERTALDIFSQLRESLRNRGIREELQLVQEKSIPRLQLDRHCTPNVFYASISYPVAFAGEQQGLIQGRVRYDYNAFILILPLILFFGVLFSIRVLTGEIVRSTRRFIIDPILMISSGTPLASRHLCVDEIIQIEENIEELKSRVAQQSRLAHESEKAVQLSRLASQVAHDIRSPLTALDMMVKDLDRFPEDQRILLRGAVARISDIANDLLSRNRLVDGPVTPAPHLTSVQLVPSLLETLITEKRIQYRSRIGIEISLRMTTSAYGLFAEINTIEFKRVISNLVNNSLEALTDEGKVEVVLTGNPAEIRVQVKDNGRGIKSEILPRLTHFGESHGKRGGSGLGLFHAKTTIEEWGGTIQIESELTVGTTVTLTLPRIKAPVWFVPALTITPDTTVVVIDDDISIHQIWIRRIEALQIPGVKIISHSSPEEAESWILSRKRSSCDELINILFLCDHEFLGSPTNGLQMIEKLEIEPYSILVTSRYENNEIREHSLRIGVPLMPKGMAGLVPIEHAASTPLSSMTRQPQAQLKQDWDAVLVDNDPLVRLTWKTAATQHGIKLLTLAMPPMATDSLVTNLPLTTPFYIDAQLDQGIRGESVISELHSHGFTELYLATGYASADFGHVPGLRAVLGKMPPWGDGVGKA